MSAPPAGGWTTGTIIELDHPTDRLVRLRFHVDDRVDHLPGQHYVVRLRAPDGYTAQRSYSVASDPDDPLLELMVECLPGGEVSGLPARRGGGRRRARAARPDRRLVRLGGRRPRGLRRRRLRGRADRGDDPLRPPARASRTSSRSSSSRAPGTDLPYAAELQRYGAFIALTRENLGDRVAAPPYPDEVESYVAGAERAYVCGSVGFASYATRLLGESGVAATRSGSSSSARPADP